MATGQFSNLRVMVNGGASDTTLVVQGPDGMYRCDDDTDGRNPVVAGPFVAGAYKVWVGSYNQGQNAAYTLGFSELNHVLPSTLAAPAGSAPAANNPPATAEMMFMIAGGFTPDPKIVSGVGGGALQASQRNAQCRGWIGAAPNHMMRVTTNIPYLAVMANSASDTTIVVQRPDGTFMCDDDGGGNRNPFVSGAFPPGVYQIFVGAYEAADRPTYRLGVSELRSVRPDALGTP